MRNNGCCRRSRSLVLILLVASVSFMDVWGESVSRKRGEEIASLFFKKAGNSGNKNLRLVYDGRRLTSHRLFPPFYLYSNSLGGYVIIAADNKAFPILGYSLSGKFMSDNMPAPMKESLSRYAAEIENIRHDGRIPTQAIAAWGNLEDYISGLLTQSEGRETWFNMSDSVAGSDIRLRHYATEYPDVLWQRESDMIPEEKSPSDFSLFDDFIKETALEKIEKERKFAERLNPTHEIIVSEGEGRYMITLPENAVLGRIYNTSGMMTDRLRFKGSHIVPVNLDKEAQGIYFLILTGESGKNYSFKLIKKY
ncbi:MAG: Spi family protease inhibitor [Muribaculaceae bacterium]|nr:Spi family protease inhibitor [Muribaculaceae bacterium]